MGTNSFDVNDGTTSTNGGYVNYSTRTYVAWNWRANGGTTSTNDDGSIQSTVQANTTAGFSIITYTGNATAGATIGHGLGKAPKWVITKARSGSYSWLVGHDGIASDAWTDALLLDTSGAASDSNLFWNDTVPSSTVVTLGGAYNPVNGNGITYVMYAFNSVEGYSKFGGYVGHLPATGNGSFVYTGFRPEFLIIKKEASEFRPMFDSKRDPHNPCAARLFPSYNYAESSEVVVDFVSNGFKARNGGGASIISSSGVSYIYWAFAESPFKNSRAR